MKEYLFLMRGGDERMAEFTEEQTQEHMAKWGAYMGKLAEGGNLKGGLPLNRDGRLMTANTVTEEMVLSAQGEYIGGYLFCNANDYEHALNLAKDCPVFELGGSIEIREAMPMDM